MKLTANVTPNRSSLLDIASCTYLGLIRMMKLPAVSLAAAKEQAKRYPLADYGYSYGPEGVKYYVYIYML